MKLDKKEYFHKITIENVKYYKTEDGNFIFTEWTGYGLLTVPFAKHVAIKRGTRKPIYTMQYGRRLFYIDIREYLLEWLMRQKEKEETEILNQEREEEYNKKTNSGNQLEINFERYCQNKYGKSSSKRIRKN